MNNFDNKKFGLNLEYLGSRYVKDYLARWESSSLDSNWWQALKFFFDHSFMRGRNDKLSEEYNIFTVKTLEEYLSFSDYNHLDSLYDQLINKKDENLFNTEGIKQLKKEKRNSVNHPNFENAVNQKNSLIKKLTTNIKIDVISSKNKHYKKDICLQNDIDLLMVLDTLNFITTDPNKINIYNYFNNLIKNAKIDEAYKELNKLYGIGDKISTFFLRDIALINKYSIRYDQVKYVFPVDTWVAQLTTLFSNKQFSDKNPNEIREYYIKNFPNYNFPLMAAGIWYLGVNSLKIAIEYIKINNMESDKS